MSSSQESQASSWFLPLACSSQSALQQSHPVSAPVPFQLAPAAPVGRRLCLPGLLLLLQWRLARCLLWRSPARINYTAGLERWRSVREIWQQASHHKPFVSAAPHLRCG